MCAASCRGPRHAAHHPWRTFMGIPLRVHTLCNVCNAVCGIPIQGAGIVNYAWGVLSRGKPSTRRRRTYHMNRIWRESAHVDNVIGHCHETPAMTIMELDRQCDHRCLGSTSVRRVNIRSIDAVNNDSKIEGSYLVGASLGGRTHSYSISSSLHSGSKPRPTTLNPWRS